MGDRAEVAPNRTPMPDEMVQVGWAYRAVYRPNAKGPWLISRTVPLPSEIRGQYFTVEVAPLYAPAGIDGFLPAPSMPGHDTTWNHATRHRVESQRVDSGANDAPPSGRLGAE